MLERAHEQGTTWNVNPEMLAVVSGRPLITTNPAWAKSLGYGSDEMRGYVYTDLLHPDDIPSAKAALDKLLRGEAVLEVENRLSRKGRKLPLVFLGLRA